MKLQVNKRLAKLAKWADSPADERLQSFDNANLKLYQDQRNDQGRSGRSSSSRMVWPKSSVNSNTNVSQTTGRGRYSDQMDRSRTLSTRQHFPPRAPSAAPNPPMNFEFSSFHQNSLSTMPNMMTSISGLGQYPLPTNRNVTNNIDKPQDSKLNSLLALQQKVYNKII